MSTRTRQCTEAGCTSKTVARRLCRAHYQAAWKAGTIGQHAPLPPRPRKRIECPESHKHSAISTCYIQHQCRCDACCKAHNERHRQRTKLKAYGRYDTGLVDAGPVRDHLLMLGEFGLGYKRVAKLSGLGITPVRNLIWGRQDPGPRKGEIQKRVKRETALRIMAVRPNVEHLAGGALVPSRGSHRRIQALVTRGWSLSKIGDLIDIDATNIGAMMERERVAVSTYRKIVTVFDELWDKAPPETTRHEQAAATRARNYAAARNWVSALAWDDIDLDDAPNVGGSESVDEVDEQAVMLASSGVKVKLSPTERRTAVRSLHGRRYSDNRIAETLCITTRTVLRIRDELGLPGWSMSELEEQAAA